MKPSLASINAYIDIARAHAAAGDLDQARKWADMACNMADELSAEAFGDRTAGRCPWYTRVAVNEIYRQASIN